MGYPRGSVVFRWPQEFLKTTPPQQYDHATAIEVPGLCVQIADVIIVIIVVVVSHCYDCHHHHHHRHYHHYHHHHHHHHHHYHLPSSIITSLPSSPPPAPPSLSPPLATGCSCLPRWCGWLILPLLPFQSSPCRTVPE